ncbi:ComEC/Rec2 family competence protein [Pseudooceanicola nanhaiensis]|uniref:ComEC/Rec2 family competence protein n=1 Tax=Pseudooceanicola nanhaiensis TaxID=375761 RepID=UPI001CD21B92|nr:ComEC/Rec2 family competence protein [Pseudooceanicola nanhaiensis]MCA0920010.1 ComEC/Rec2 family competence protein [Pseudooceanicola nanhaiensis]
MARVLLGQRGHLFPWAPVCFAAGIGGYFALRAEPPAIWLVWLGGLALLAGILAVRLESSVRHIGLAPLAWALALSAGGLGWAGARAHMVAAPVLESRLYGPVQGRIIAMDRSASDALRLELDRVILAGRGPAATPARVRIALHGQEDGPEMRPGATVLATAHLAPPGGPVEPGGFDFRRHAWFDRLGGLGYSRVPVVTLLPPEPGALRLYRWRMAIADHVRAAIPGEAGAFAAAVTTGDRSGIGQPALEALRRSNLAHLLAISGLHMGLLASVVFAALRLALALVPWVALRWPCRSIAALGALMAAAVYLALSGGNVATERAFIMVAVALVALFFDRRALSLRAVALAAMIVLILRPEALLGPGLQMSFAATVALVAVFALLRGRESPLPRWIRPVTALILSSAVAGAATGPVGAAHFNQMALYGLPANLLCVPVMGLLVVPAAVAAALLAPLGLEALPLWCMGQGLDWILLVAREVSARPGAVSGVVTPPAGVLPLLALGGLMLALWQGRGRLVGVIPVCAALWLWSGAARPLLLVEAEGRLVGLMTGEGRALSRDRAAGFAAGVWLENDGDLSPQRVAAARWQAPRLPDGRLIRHVTGKATVGALSCTAEEIVVVNAKPPPGLPCETLDPAALRRGALSYHDGRWIGADDGAARLWTPQPRTSQHGPSQQGRRQ